MAAPLFRLGQVTATPGALEALEAAHKRPLDLLTRHITGDWGDVDSQDAAENELSIAKGYRILSAYNLPNDTRIWIITEADRSSTTLLLPDEY
jgi:hypothetical protein